MLKPSTWLVVAVFCALCSAALVWDARASDTERPKTIGIVAAMGDTLELRRVGVMVFGNSSATADITDWKIDDEVAAAAAGVLKGRFETIVIGDPDKARFRPDGPGFFGAQIDEEEATKALASRPGAPRVDAYLLIYPLFNTNPISLNNQWLKGPGLYREASWEAVYCLGIMAVVDASTFDTIERKWLTLRSEDKYTGSDLPYRRVEGVVPEDFSKMTPEQRRQAEIVMKELLREAVENTLQRLRLVR